MLYTYIQSLTPVPKRYEIIVPGIDHPMQSLFISTATVIATLVLLGVVVNQAESLSNG